MADLAGDHPVPQRPLRGVVGQRQFGIVQHLEDRVPVVEQLHRQRVGLGVRVALVLLAGGAQLGQELGMVSSVGKSAGGPSRAAYTAAISACIASRTWRPKARTSRG